ncbi:hypothetical protein PHISCL_02688 [Aspergillus sclerotialis]|uniref:Uncharacterized protein n=1 Tax=Aspergillus sclerotialis TaxID=2070753 RepID=A0A3A2ZUB5_9EURO|nr:hypothetical protein PHISCL_02688 [Aspergillus sclerotialis]
MPEIIIVNDNASFTTSSSYTSGTTKPQASLLQPLRRKPTIQRFSRWVTKQISRPRLRNEQLLSPGEFEHHSKSHNEGFESREALAEIANGLESTRQKEKTDEAIYTSYAAFCDAFTSSGQRSVQVTDSIGEDGKRECSRTRVRTRNPGKKHASDVLRIEPMPTPLPAPAPAPVLDPISNISTDFVAPASPTHLDSSPIMNESQDNLISPVDSGCYPYSSSSFEACRGGVSEKVDLPEPLSPSIPLALGEKWGMNAASSPIDNKDLHNPFHVSGQNEDTFHDEAYYGTDTDTDTDHATAINRDPTPPPEILTPALYAQMSRTAIAEERKMMKAKRRWGCFSASGLRALFLKGRGN